MTIPNVKSKDGTRGTLMHPFDVAVDAEMRWGALWKLALGAVAMQAYCAPLRVLEREYAGANESAQLQQQNPEGMLYEQYQDVLFLRLWLTFAATLCALSGVIAKQVVAASCLHAVIHVARSVSDAPPIVAMPSLLSVLYHWKEHSVESCVYEYASLLSFALLLRYVLFPPQSALLAFQRHSRHLKQFFKQHDAQFVPLVDRLLEEYTGNERLLYARIRRLYRDKKTSAHLKTP